MRISITASALALCAGWTSVSSAQPYFQQFGYPNTSSVSKAYYQEARGKNDVVGEASRWLGVRNMTGKGGPWCAAFADLVLRKTGHAALKGDTASSALSYGRRLSGPEVGALAVISTRYGWAGHVGFVSEINTNGSVKIISGNWGHRVANADIPLRQIVAFIEVR